MFTSSAHLLGHADDEGYVGCVLLGGDGQEAVPGPRLLGDDVHQGAPGPVGDGQQPRRHHLNNTWGEMRIKRGRAPRLLPFWTWY